MIAQRHESRVRAAAAISIYFYHDAACHVVGICLGTQAARPAGRGPSSRGRSTLSAAALSQCRRGSALTVTVTGGRLGVQPGRPRPALVPRLPLSRRSFLARFFSKKNELSLLAV